MTKKTKIKIGILVMCMSSLCYLSLSPIIADVAADFPAVDVSLIQLIISLPAFMSIVCSPLSGKMIQYIPTRTLGLFGMSMYLIGGLIPFFLHSNIWIILACSLIIGIGGGILNPLINAIICENFELEERGPLMGLNATFVALGALLFIFVGGQLSRFGWHYCYLTFLLTGVYLAIVAVTIPKGKSKSVESSSQGSGFEMNPYIAFVFVVGFLFFVFQNAYNTNSSIYISERGFGGADVASMATMANTLGGMVGGVLFGFLYKKLSDHIHTAALAIPAVGFLLASFVPALGSVLASGALVGFGFALYNASGTLLLSKYLKPENNAFTVSIYLAVINVATSLSPLVVNPLARIMGEDMLQRFLLSGVVIAVLAVTALVVNRKHAKA
ncbi:MAG: MFS transporter [Eubacteriales bacterium]|nr:MFS transporter [Eubacteriales bacterium]